MRAPSLFDDDAARRLEAVYRTADMVAQRAEVLRILDPRPGEHVLDVGSGPGFVLQEIAERVEPGGGATGVDASDSMLAVWRKRAASAPALGRLGDFGSPSDLGTPNLAGPGAGEGIRTPTSRSPAPSTTLGAEATRLPFAGATFDAAVSTQVLEYVPDIPAALAELHRVLRPGGRALILDTDWDSLVWSCEDRALMDRVIAGWLQRFAHPYLPRSLSRQLREAGFGAPDVHAWVIVNAVYDPQTYSATNIDLFGDFVTATSSVSPDDVARWKDDLRHCGEGGDYFFSLNRYLFLAEKA